MLMRAVAMAALAAAGVQVADAACANACSGHGRCTNYKPTFSSAPDYYYMPTAGSDALGYDTAVTKKDSCTCFLRREEGTTNIYDYGDPDCSKKVCPSGEAINQIPFDGTNSHAQKVECSNVGTCDRATGICQCQPGFTGKSCNRRLCPNDCSGRGQCRLLSEIIAEVKSNDANLAYDTATLVYGAFDEDTSAGCMCDKGFRGPDCSIVECPSTTDWMGGYGSESGRECSGRGQCDYSRGVCTCFSGYHGTSCEQQLVNMG